MQKLDMYEFCAIALNKGCRVTSFEVGERAILTNGDVITEVTPSDYYECIIDVIEDGKCKKYDAYHYDAGDYIITCAIRDDVDEVIDVYFKKEKTFVSFDSGSIERFELNHRLFRTVCDHW